MSGRLERPEMRSGRNAHIFQPPRPSATSSTTPTRAPTIDYFTSQSSRKRHRHGQVQDYSNGTQRNPNYTSRQYSGDQYCSTNPTNWAQTPGNGNQNMQDSTNSDFWGQNSTHVNEIYSLAGGLDTPSFQAAAIDYEQPASEFELERRRQARGGEGTGGEQLQHLGAVRVENMPIFGPLARERNGVARVSCSQEEQQQRQQDYSVSLQYNHDGGGSGGKMGWTNFAFNVVGRLFNFGSNVFRGFYAGGGKGYDFRCTPQAASTFQPQWTTAVPSMSPPLPGSWHTDNQGFFGDFEQDNPSHTHEPQERPTAKRRQTDKESWVMVGTPDLDSDSPRRKTSSATTAPSRHAFVTQRPAASRASSRRSMIPTPASRKSSYHASPTSNHTSTVQASSGADLSRRASFANTRSPPARVRRDSYGFPRPGTPNSPSYISPQAEKYARRQAKRDKVNDHTMTNMSRNIQDLIRQAQEALGTKFSVEGDATDFDEGYVDEDW